MVTGKNKEQFEKWFLRDFMGYKDPRHLEQYKKIELERFYNMPFEMQIGVYLAYYDSLGITISVNASFDSPLMNGTFMNGFEAEMFRFDETKRLTHSNRVSRKVGSTRNESYKEAFKKADELINKQLN